MKSRIKRNRALKKLFPVITHPELVPIEQRHPVFRYGDMAQVNLVLDSGGNFVMHWDLFFVRISRRK